MSCQFYVPSPSPLLFSEYKTATSSGSGAGQEEAVEEQAQFDYFYQCCTSYLKELSVRGQPIKVVKDRGAKADCRICMRVGSTIAVKF